MTALDRLSEIIEEKDREIRKLNSKIEDMEFNSNLQEMAGFIRKAFENDEFNKQMPYPRIEMRFSKLGDDWYNHKWVYGIVYKPYWEIGKNNDILLFLPISETKGSGGGFTFESQCYDEKLPAPFRDGIHVLADAVLFNLPVYITCKEENICQQLDLSEFDGHILENVNLMKSNG